MNLLTVIPKRLYAVWAILVMLTVATYALGIDHGAGSLVVLIVWTIAVFKVRVIGLEFMELRAAPLALRSSFELCSLILWALLSAMYVWA
ncbi:cytochrome C oxidase subunit IV family protein [Mycobacterium sp. E796]|uniref:cytochrome C oxidase subunit IV family protein n=1 Tax=Mycobacterium sp. E796 TaxID=1834151 RepID=UPI0007FE7951|nr:cytochrome C oxidase subunit IV family protein [Mycobacterium sp. E796]OBI50101.1 hypothetical protein A5706_25580 [Mycobacterium sp. E796]